MSTSRILRAPFVLAYLALSSGCVAETLDAEADDDSASAVEPTPLTTATPACGPSLVATRVTASGAQEGNPASQAVDGQLGTRWSQLGIGAFITLDLGASKALCGVGVAWYQGASRTNDFTVSLSSDGVSFTQARAGTSTGRTSSLEPYAVTASARYVRLTVNGNSQNDWASVSELQVYGATVAQTVGLPGSYKPSAATTGVPAGVTLTPYNTSGADLVITTDGTTLDQLDIYGDIKVRAKNVTIKRSRLHGGRAVPRGNTGIVDANSSNVAALVVEDCTITPDAPSYYRDGIVGHDYTARRNHIYKTNDGLGIFNVPGGATAANVKVEANYIHTLTFWSDDPAHSDGTHNDCIQVQGGENIHIVGNTIKCDQVIGSGSGPSSRGTHAGLGIMLQQNVSKLKNVIVEGNWVDDGGSSINVDHTPSKGYTNITLTLRENKLGRNQLDFGSGSKYPIRIIDKSASTVLGLDQNRWEDTGILLREGRDLGIRYNSQ
jgi:hypothetical protein